MTILHIAGWVIYILGWLIAAPWVARKMREPSDSRDMLMLNAACGAVAGFFWPLAILVFFIAIPVLLIYHLANLESLPERRRRREAEKDQWGLAQKAELQATIRRLEQELGIGGKS